MTVNGRMIVDAQAHLWKAESDDWKWVPGRKPQLPEPFTIERLVPLMDEAGVDRAVIVPPSWPGDRNDYGLEAARRYPQRFGVMGRITLEKPEQSSKLLPTWRDQPGMLGVRLTFQREHSVLLTSGAADWFWPAAEKAGLPVMFLSPGNLPRFASIAERHPGLTLIIDHMGMTAELAKERRIPQAIDDVVALAKYPNVSVKLSSAPNFSLEAYPFRDLNEHLKRCFDAYGPRRCHWGTDLTNTLAKATYRQRIEHFTKELDFLSEEDKDWVMGRSILERLKWA
ncbi:MAG TPA: amidohydrolase family protein [Xanthobacteraceae bacterium]|nr:amidohydrolase family protein [Xanthobacteraceae bacterium]